jgi:hypothetical protein
MPDKTFISSLSTSGASPEDILKNLDTYDIDWYVSEAGDLYIRTWQIGAEDFVSSEKASEIRADAEFTHEHNELDWLSSNFQRVRDQYPDRWVAISGNEVIEAADTLDELIQRLPEDEKPFVIFIPSEPVVWDFAYGN